MLTKLTKSRISAPSALEDGEHPRQSLRPAEAQSGGGCVNSTDRAAQTDGGGGYIQLIFPLDIASATCCG